MDIPGRVTTIVVQTTDLMAVKEAAAQLGRPKMTIYRWLEAGRMLGVQLDGILYVPRSEVERLKAEQDKAQADPAKQ